ncbi:beta/gamma crystallin domain-containing protein 1 isoform X1 [Syngnathus typhle]|uniref:beta/gamma crystallin domain-containing protein 1 isoform X1 n=1 Tax=Syngnathus typhle TaxID=161592 RepID=UPI002A6AE3EB|nr:beta/gamma crystallin domain-containing protein 1 isoform X1 [Syngnathus typhle]
MAKKTLSKKSFKKFFSRSEPHLEESSVNKTDEKKKFKLPKLKLKSKGSTSSQKQQLFRLSLHSPDEPNTGPVNRSSWGGNVSDKTSSFISATGPRSKAQELSYSETDLHKPNKFATFSFGLLKKRKKKKEENVSQSTSGLNSPDAHAERNEDLHQMVDRQGKRKAMLSVSQPALDTKDSFDIPSPPSIHSKLIKSYYALSHKTPPTQTTKARLEEHLTNGSPLPLHDKAKIIPVQAEEKENIPVDDNRFESNHTSDSQPSKSSSYQPPDDVIGGNLAEEPTQSNADIDVSIGRPSFREMRDGEANTTEAVPSSESAPVQQAVSFPHIEQTLPDTSTKTISPPADQDVVYSALYESLFPRSFTSEVLSSLPTSPVDISHESESEPLSYFQKETNIYENPSQQTFYSFDTSQDLINPESPRSYLPSATYYSEQLDSIKLNSRYEERFDLNSAPPVSQYVTSQETDTRVTESKRRAILVKELVTDETSTESGLSSSKLNEVTPAIDFKIKMEADKDLVSSPPPGLIETYPMPCSPVYLSVGSDDGSTMDVYFSAEEDNMESLDEPTLIMEQIEEEESFLGPSEISDFEKAPAEFLQVEDGNIVTQVLPQIKGELPAAPVLQVKAAMVCEFAAPYSNREGEGGDEPWINVTQTVDRLHEENQPINVQSPQLLPNNTRQEDFYEFKDTAVQPVPTSDLIQEKSQENTFRKNPCIVSSTLTLSAELQSDATPVEHKRVTQESEWVDTITESTGNGVRPNQVAVELSDLQVDTQPPQRETAEEPFGKREHLTEADLKQRSPTPSSEGFNADPPKTLADQEPDVEMNSGYSSLSSNFSTKKSPPDKLDESRYQFRQASLLHDNAPKQDVLDYGRMESNGTNLSTEHGWKTTFEGVSRFTSKEEPLFSPSYRLSDTSSSSTYSSAVFPEATSYSYSSQSELGGQPAFSADDTDASCFTGVFTATLVELDDRAGSSSTPPASPDVDASQFDMDNLVDTLKNMGPSLRQRSVSLRGPTAGPVSALPPIVEDASSPVTSDISSPTKRSPSSASEALNGIYKIPADLGLKRSASRDTRSPLELMKKEPPATRDMPVRASATKSILMRQSSDTSDENKSLNGNSSQQSSSNSRLDSSYIFGSYKPPSVDQTQENAKFHRSVLRTGSLPDMGPSNLLKERSEINTSTDSSSRFERLSLLTSSPPSASSFSSVSADARKSLPSHQSISSFTSSSTTARLLSPTGSLENHRLFPTTESSSYAKFGQTVGQGIGTSAISTPSLQRSFSHDSMSVGSQQNPLINNNLLRGAQVPKVEPERNVKYRAFPDAYLTKEKEHGKLNPRPGKMYIFDRPGMCGQRIELSSDVVDATSWELQETISIRVVRGGWVLYEKRNFKGEKIALDEGDIEITCPFPQSEEEGEQQTNGQKVTEEKKEKEQNGEPSEGETKAKRFIIGSIRRVVRDYSVPEISLFPEENAEGKKVIFRDTSEDARIFGFPIRANSIIINAGLWLVFSKPFFEGSPRVLEVGGYSNPASWAVEQPYVGSLHPLKIGEPKVENIGEPKLEVFERSYFTGKSRMLTGNTRDFMTRVDRQQGAFMYSVGSLKVHGGMWVGYEKEGYRGNQYLLEEGEYHDWRVWGATNSELRSVRLLQADLSDPLMVLFEQPEEEEGVAQEENTFEVTEAIPDVELFGYKINTRSLQVFSGLWVAYSHVDYSGNQYILEKGFYSNCADWGSRDTRICSVQPIRLAPSDGNRTRNEILLYSEPEYRGKCLIFNYKEEAATEEFQIKSCRVVGGSWVLYENKDFSGIMYVLSEGGYSTLISMGCTPSTFIRSVKAVPMTFSVPSISLFGLEGLEGREIATDSELVNMVAEGFNDHVLSVRVNSGCWVLCEFSNYRGRQFLLEPIEITNWPKFSSVQTVGSMYPVRQKRHYFRIRNAESRHLMSIQGGVEEMKSGRVVVAPEVEPMSDIWFYQDGLIKNKLSPVMSLQVMGNVESGAKLILWNETRQPSQTWTAQMTGRLSSITFPGMVIDVKGGQNYDKEHVVIMPENDERLSQQWELVLLK